jgi:hypothetical protein
VGPERLDVLAAMIVAAVANVFRDKKSKTVQVSECMPDWERATREGGGLADGSGEEPDPEDLGAHR